MDCADKKSLLFDELRWFWNQDMNCDGVFTIDDIWLMVKYVYFAPADSFIFLALRNEEHLRVLFEVTPEAITYYGGWFSGIDSASSWLAAGALIRWLFIPREWYR